MSHTSSSNIDIAELRKLLERWYEGLTSPEEENILIREFSSRDTSTLPSDLAEERMIFTAMSTPPVSEIEAEHAIYQAINSHSNNKNVFRRYFVRMAVAACTALILATGISMILSSSEPQCHRALLASVSMPDIKLTRPAPATYIGTPTVEPTSVAASPGNITKKSAAATPASTPVAGESSSCPQADYGYRKPTVEEAEAILLALNNVQRKIIDTTDNTYEQVNSSLHIVKKDVEEASEYMEYEAYFELLNL